MIIPGKMKKGNFMTSAARMIVPLFAIVLLLALVSCNNGETAPFGDVLNINVKDGEPANGFKWEHHYSEIKITGYVGDSNDLVVPTSINGKPVTRIESRAFENFTSMNSIVLPKGLTSIGSLAFYGCTGLKTIVIPASVVEISSLAFSGCKNLNEIQYVGNETKWKEISPGLLNSDLKTIKTVFICSFDGNTTVKHDYQKVRTVEPTCTTHGSEIYQCTKCKDEYETSVPALGHQYQAEETQKPTCTADGIITYRCKRCSDNYQESAKALGHHYVKTACERCGKPTSDLLKYTLSPDGKTYEVSGIENCTDVIDLIIPAEYRGLPVNGIGFLAFSMKKNISNVVVSEGVTTIGGSAFSQSSIRSIDMPDSVISIGGSAFNGCSNLESVKFSNRLEKIDSYAFNNCGKLTNLTFGTGLKRLELGAFSGSGLTRIALPDGLEYIGGSVFANCSKLESVDLPDSLKTIESHAFSECTSLRQISIPGSLGYLSGYVFIKCRNLNYVVFEDGFINIGSFVFQDCSGLETIVVPSSLKTIGGYAFNNCTALKTVRYAGTEEQWGKVNNEDNGRLINSKIWENVRVIYNATES